MMMRRIVSMVTSPVSVELARACLLGVVCLDLVRVSAGTTAVLTEIYRRVANKALKRSRRLKPVGKRPGPRLSSRESGVLFRPSVKWWSQSHISRT